MFMPSLFHDMFILFLFWFLLVVKLLSVGTHSYDKTNLIPDSSSTDNQEA